MASRAGLATPRLALRALRPARHPLVALVVTALRRTVSEAPGARARTARLGLPTVAPGVWVGMAPVVAAPVVTAETPSETGTPATATLVETEPLPVPPVVLAVTAATPQETGTPATAVPAELARTAALPPIQVATAPPTAGTAAPAEPVGTPPEWVTAGTAEMAVSPETETPTRRAAPVAMAAMAATEVTAIFVEARAETVQMVVTGTMVATAETLVTAETAAPQETRAHLVRQAKAMAGSMMVSLDNPAAVAWRYSSGRWASEQMSTSTSAQR
ncbi:MAG: hypothetical protein FJ247_13550 [Nitrospira sp.]|nr:hypothetical protein [Nitrospira sp.]